MTVTDILALIGALTGTLAILWDIFKWKNSGARLKINVAPNMILIADGLSLENQEKRISVEVVNVGQRNTTVVTLCFRCDDDMWTSVTGKGRTYFAVPQPEFASLPAALGVGERWVGMVHQSPELEEMARHKRLYVQISHSVATKPVCKRLKLKA